MEIINRHTWLTPDGLASFLIVWAPSPKTCYFPRIPTKPSLHATRYNIINIPRGTPKSRPSFLPSGRHRQSRFLKTPISCTTSSCRRNKPPPSISDDEGVASAIRNPTHADARPDPICLSTPGPPSELSSNTVKKVALHGTWTAGHESLLRTARYLHATTATLILFLTVRVKR